MNYCLVMKNDLWYVQSKTGKHFGGYSLALAKKLMRDLENVE